MKNYVLLCVILLVSSINLSAQDVTVDDGGVLTINAPATVNNLTLNGSGLCDLNGNALTITGTLTINSGATLKDNIGGGSINLTGDLICDGTFGESGVDRIDVYFNGGAQTISGNGLFYASKFHRDVDNAPNTLKLDKDINLYGSGNVLLITGLNKYTITVSATYTWNALNGYISFDQVGASVGGTGTLDIKGIVNTQALEFFNDNTGASQGSTCVAFSTSVINVQEIRFRESTFMSGIMSEPNSKIYLTGTEPFATYPAINTNIYHNLSGEVHYSKPAVQTISNVLSYFKLFLEGTGNKTIKAGQELTILSDGSLTLGGAAKLAKGSGANLTYNSNSTLIYAWTSGNYNTSAEITTTSFPRNVTINSSGDVILKNSIDLGSYPSATLTFLQGNLNTKTNTTKVTLYSSSNLVGETNLKHIIGDVTLSSILGDGSTPTVLPAGEYFGLTLPNDITDADGSDITISRKTGTALTSAYNSNQSILRYWTISGTNLTYSGGNITSKWFTSELNSKQMSNAVIYENFDNSVSPFWFSKNDVLGINVTPSSDEYTLASTIAPSFSGIATTIYTVGDVASPMPVELTSFIAKSDTKGVVLNWETATEVSNHGFDVERALVNADGKTGNFSKLGFVNGNGNSNSPKSYSFVDNKAVYGKYVYRLKQVDTDGKFEYSKNVEVEVKNLPTTFVMDQNYPNPFNPSTTISFSVPKASFVNISVYNMLGQKVATIANEVMQEGAYERSFNSTNLSSGNYIYIMTSGNAKIVKKMTLVK